MASQSKPEILLLSLSAQGFFDDQFASLIDTLSESSQLKRAKSASGAIQYLNNNNPSAILITDEGLAKKGNKPVLDRVIEYIRNGGLAVASLHFPSFINQSAFDHFFGAFDLPWTRGDYDRTTFQFNPASTFPGLQTAAVPERYSMKALRIKNARPHEKIYVPVAGAKTESRVFPPGHVDEAQAAVVGAKLGDGYLVYIGDVNNEEESVKILLALFGF